MKRFCALGLLAGIAACALAGGVAPSEQFTMVSSNATYVWTNATQPKVLTSVFLSPVASGSITCTLVAVQGSANNQLDSSASAASKYKWVDGGTPIPINKGDKVSITLATGTAVTTNLVTLNFRTQD